MDFRVLDIVVDTEAHQVLLERIEDDGQWRVVVGVFVNIVDRFDEWIPCKDPEAVQACIAAYPEEQAHAFIQRAKAWYAEDYRLRALRKNVSPNS